jgi:hypothetical protein
MCVPMLALTNKWLDIMSGRPIAGVLHKALSGCLDKLSATFKGFVAAQVRGAALGVWGLLGCWALGCWALGCWALGCWALGCWALGCWALGCWALGCWALGCWALGCWALGSSCDCDCAWQHPPTAWDRG